MRYGLLYLYIQSIDTRREREKKVKINLEGENRGEGRSEMRRGK